MHTDSILPRDFSWLQFNHRVLQEAADPRVPLYERISFLAIYSSNLDEFYRVRIATLRSFRQLKKATRKELNVRPKKELKLIQAIVMEQQQWFGQIWVNDILPTLAENGVHLIRPEQFDEQQKKFAEDYFQKHLRLLTDPIWVSEEVNVPFLDDKGLYLLVSLNEAHSKIACIKIPSNQLDRFIQLPEKEGQKYITFLDDIIRLQLKDIFKGETIHGAWSVKISRDAEMYIEDEFEGDLVDKIKKGLEKRDIGLPTRFLYDEKMPEELVLLVKEKFDLSKYDLVPGARYHNFNDFFSFPNPLGRASWHNEAFPPLPHQELENEPSLMQAIKKKDYILHFPYHKFDYVPRFITEAAEDKNVDAIKITLYRVASKSAVTEALMYALKKGKKVLAFIEAKARFDEASNLYWGERLQKSGAVVIYSYPGIKVHTKLLLVRKIIEGKKKFSAYIGTGNFNEKTARIYCDHALLTANKKIVNEVSQVFDILERKIIVPKTQHVFISPFSTRQGFLDLIDQEIAAAKAGKEAYMILKMNSLEDPGMIKKLYDASRAGVNIQLIIRGICCLIPGVENQSENIKVISIIDRFLEHARIYIFCNGGQEKMYIASADWMTRNLDRRIEVAVPILDQSVYKELRDIINLQLADNQRARYILAEGTNPYVEHLEGQVKVRSQVDTYKMIEKNKNFPV